MGAFQEAAGLKSLDEAYLLHVNDTGREGQGCSAFGISLAGDGPAMLTTADPVSERGMEQLLTGSVLKDYPDSRPHRLLGIGSRHHATIWRSVNDAGLLAGWASGHSKFT